MNPEVYQQVYKFIQNNIHIPSMLIPTTLIASRKLGIDEDEVIDVYELMAQEGLIIEHSQYLYEISPLFGLTNELKDKLRKYELSQTTNRLF